MNMIGNNTIYHFIIKKRVQKIQKNQQKINSITYWKIIDEFLAPNDIVLNQKIPLF